MKRLGVYGFALGAVLFLMNSPILGQRLYDQDRDEQAQAAKKLIDNLQSGTLFDKQLKNLALLAKQDIETALIDGQSQMRARIGNFYTWRRIDDVVTNINKGLSIGDNQPDEEQRKLLIASLKARIGESKAELKNLQSEAACKKDPDKCDDAKASELSLFFQRVDDLKEYEDYLTELQKKDLITQGDVETVQRVLDTLEVLKGTYKNYANRISEYNKLVGALIELRVPLKKIALQALAVEVEHWENVGRIRVRRAEEGAQVKLLISEYRAFRGKSLFPNDENIEMSLRALIVKSKDAAKVLAEAEDRPRTSNDSRTTAANSQNHAAVRSRRSMRTPSQIRPMGTADAIYKLRGDFIAQRKKLQEALYTLYFAAAIAARGDLPTRLATLRLAQEEHAFSIRKSGVMARAYELTVSTGVQRLALYHQGGLKPTKIAELIHAAATVAIPPILATR
jgi:hypothetical protein